MIEQLASEEWRDFLEAYTRRHRGSAATLEVKSPQGREFEDVAGQRFNGARIEEYEGGEMIFLNFGDRCQITRCVADPSALAVERGEDGSDRGIELATADGSVVRLRHADRTARLTPIPRYARNDTQQS